jgi:hypothetical protein
MTASVEQKSVFFLEIVLGIAEFSLSFTGNFLRGAFDCQLVVADHLAGDFLDLAFRFFDAALYLIFVDTHDLLLDTHAGNARQQYCHYNAQPTRRLDKAQALKGNETDHMVLPVFIGFVTDCTARALHILAGTLNRIATGKCQGGAGLPCRAAGL